MIGKFILTDCVSSMSPIQRLWLSTGSTLRAMTLTPRLSNSGLMRATVPSSVVHTGVKSLGCENSTPQELPSHWWNLILPAVVSASKSGAVSPRDSDMAMPRWDCGASMMPRSAPQSRAMVRTLRRGRLAREAQHVLRHRAHVLHARLVLEPVVVVAVDREAPERREQGD